jgi:hypothetical protein
MRAEGVHLQNDRNSAPRVPYPVEKGGQLGTKDDGAMGRPRLCATRVGQRSTGMMAIDIKKGPTEI